MLNLAVGPRFTETCLYRMDVIYPFATHFHPINATQRSPQVYHIMSRPPRTHSLNSSYQEYIPHVLPTILYRESHPCLVLIPPPQLPLSFPFPPHTHARLSPSSIQQEPPSPPVSLSYLFTYLLTQAPPNASSAAINIIQHNQTTLKLSPTYLPTYPPTYLDTTTRAGLRDGEKVP